MPDSSPHSELRAKIVTALNLTPLVPPQADTETLDVVDEAWQALTQLLGQHADLIEQLEASREMCRRISDQADALAQDRVERNACIKGLEEQLQTAERQRDLLQREANMTKRDAELNAGFAAHAERERDAALDREAGTSDALQELKEQLESVKRDGLRLRERLDQAEAFIDHLDANYRYAEWLGENEDGNPNPARNPDA